MIVLKSVCKAKTFIELMKIQKSLIVELVGRPMPDVRYIWHKNYSFRTSRSITKSIFVLETSIMLNKN